MVLILMQHFRLAKSKVFSKFAVVVRWFLCIKEDYIFIIQFFTENELWKPAFW